MSDDFFKILESDQGVNSGSADEIVFRDENGALKVLRNGAVTDLDEQNNVEAVTPRAKDSALVSVKPVPAISPSAVVVAPKAVVVSATPPAASDLDQAVKEAVKQSGLSLTDDILVNRFRNLVLSRLKGVRNRSQVYETLIAKNDQGGMGLDEATADRVGVILNKAYDAFHSHERQMVSVSQFSDLQTEAQRLLSEVVAEKPRLTFLPPPAMASLPLKPVAVPPAPTKPVFKKSADIPALPPKKPTSPPPPLPPVSEPLGKPRIEDVRYQPKLTGPIDELRTMTLSDFRRLAATPALATAKILEKLELLEEESFTNKISGIRAWKENEISRLYVALGQAGMDEHRPIAEIIAQRQRASQPTLTEAEIEAVIELNKKLRH